MNRFYSIFIIMIGVTSFAHAQESDMSFKLYRTWVKINQEEKKVQGFLYQTNDSGIYLTFSKKKADYRSGLLEKKYYSAENILNIQTRRKGNATRGTWYGLLSGLTAGGLIGYASMSGFGKDSYGFVGMVLGGTSGMLVGTIVGTIVGSIKKTHPVNMTLNQYQSIQPELKKVSIKKD